MLRAKEKNRALLLVTVNSETAYNLLRFEADPELGQAPHGDTALLNVTGFFSNVANDNGRRKLGKNMVKLLGELPSLEEYLLGKLYARSLFPGADIVVMVANAGEIDLFANLLAPVELIIFL